MNLVSSIKIFANKSDAFDACTDVGILKAFRIISSLITVIKILVPIILIVTSMITLFKAIMASDDKEIRNSVFLCINKFIVGAFIFFIPTLVNAVFSYVNTTSKFINITKCLNNSKNIAYYENLQKIKNEQEKLAKENKRKQLSNQSASISKSYDTSTTSEGSLVGKTYNLSESDLIFLSKVAKCEQGSVEGAKAEASLMANQYELFGSNYSSLRSYVQNSGWFACANYVSSTSISNSDLSAIKSVLVLGNRTLALYVDEHDCINCNPSTCSNGNRGDICKLVTNGNTVTSMSSLKNHSSYVRDKTVIYNLYTSVYTFYTFPCDSCDPFGYTANAKSKYDSLNRG